MGTDQKRSKRQRPGVLHLVNGEFYAGAERVQDLLALRLPEFGYDVGFVCLKDGIFPEKRMADEVPLTVLPMKSPADISPALQIARLVRREGYDLIHTHTVRGALLGQLASIMSGVPMVHHVHSPTAQDTEHRIRNLRNSTVEKASLRRARRLMPVSRSLFDYLLQRGFGEPSLRLVCNGVPSTEPARKLPAPDEPFVVGTVALFRPRKGIEVLIDALAALDEEGLDVHLHAVGPFESDEYRLQVLHRIREAGLQKKVVWTGFTEQVGREFHKMNAFVLPSLFGEGMPMVILEAMAAGLPVIGTRVEGVPQVIRHGKEGLIAEPGDVPGLAACIRDLASGRHDAGKLGDAGRARQQRHFSDESMARTVSQVYDELEVVNR